MVRQDELWLSLLPYSGRVNLKAYPDFFEPAPLSDPVARSVRILVTASWDRTMTRRLSHGKLPNPRLAKSFGFLKMRLCPSSGDGAGRLAGWMRVRRAVSELERQDARLHPLRPRDDLGLACGIAALVAGLARRSHAPNAKATDGLRPGPSIC